MFRLEICVKPDKKKTSLKELKNNQHTFSINFKRIGQVITKPRSIFSEIEQENSKKADWKSPIVVVTVIVLIASLLSVTGSTSSSSSGSTTSNSTSSTNGGGMPGGGGMGGGMGGMGGMGGGQSQSNSDEEETAETNSTESESSSTLLTKILSALGNVAGFILTWLCLGSLVNLFSISFGGQGNTKMSLVFVAWACIPVGIRAIMQIMYVLATTTSINAVGLSGFISNAETSGAILLQKTLAQIDIYLVWQVVLLVLGTSVMTKLNRKKSIIIALSSIILVIFVKSLFGLGFEKLASIEINSGILNNLIR